MESSSRCVSRRFAPFSRLSSAHAAAAAAARFAPCVAAARYGLLQLAVNDRSSTASKTVKHYSCYHAVKSFNLVTVSDVLVIF